MEESNQQLTAKLTVYSKLTALLLYPGLNNQILNRLLHFRLAILVRGLTSSATSSLT